MTYFRNLGRYRTLRVRLCYSALALITILVGLMVHLRGAGLGHVARDMLGDALWAAMIFWFADAIAPRASVRRLAGATLAFCFFIEISQLWHTPWLDALRHTTAGHLVLGSGFDARDFASYTAGVTAAALLERGLATSTLFRRLETD